MQIAEVITGSQNHPIETPLEVQMASPNGLRQSEPPGDAQVDPSRTIDHHCNQGTDEDSSMHVSGDAGSPLAAEARAETHGVLARSHGSPSPCPASTPTTKGPIEVSSSLVPEPAQGQRAAAGAGSVGGGGSTVAPLFSFAGLPVKSVGFGSKASTAGRQINDVLPGTHHASSAGTTVPAPVASRHATGGPQRSMAGMFGGATTVAGAAARQGTSSAAGVAQRPAVKSMAGMFGAPVRKAPKTVHKLEVPAAATGDCSAAIAATSPSLPNDRPADAEAGEGTFGAGDTEQRKSAVQSVMAALREGADDPGSGYKEDGDAGDVGEGGQIGEGDGGELTSLRDRFNNKRRRERAAGEPQQQPGDRELDGGTHGTGGFVSSQNRDSGEVLGDVTSITFSKKSRMAGERDGGLRQASGAQAGRRKERRRDEAEFEEAFDYEAVLDGSDRNGPRERRSVGGRDGGNRGRGQRGGRRGGSGAGGGGRKAWNPFQVSEADVGAAKRSGNSRNGNRSAAFGNNSRR